MDEAAIKRLYEVLARIMSLRGDAEIRVKGMRRRDEAPDRACGNEKDNIENTSGV